MNFTLTDDRRMLRDTLDRFVGERYALRDPAAMQPYLHEWRGLWDGVTPLVLRPGTTEEVSRILAIADETGTAVITQSGNTGLVGGQIPVPGKEEILMVLDRMTAIREVDTADNTMTVEAGVILKTVQDEADKVGRLFPLRIASEGSCRIGGNLATNAGGTAVLAYGTARDLVLGLEVVLADGTVWNGLRTLRKDNTGYDLRHLFMGSEGTLGIVTAAALKLFPRPRARATVFAATPSPEAALKALALLRGAAPGTVTSFELMPRIGLDFVLAHVPGTRDPLAAPSPWYLLIEIAAQAEAGFAAGVEAALAAALDSGALADAALAASQAQARAFWHLRDSMSGAQKGEGGSIKHDVAVPVAVVPHFIEAASAAATALVPGCRPVPFGHLGDGNIHFNITQPRGADTARFLDGWAAMNEAVHAVVARFGGSISAEHGIGVAKAGLLAGVKSPVEMDLMRRLKAMLDPQGILNPGKVIAGIARPDATSG